MNIYRAVGRRTDLAKGCKGEIVTMTGSTPRDARQRLMSSHMHLVDVYTELIPREERYAEARRERAR